MSDNASKQIMSGRAGPLKAVNRPIKAAFESVRASPPLYRLETARKYSSKR